MSQLVSNNTNDAFDYRDPPTKARRGGVKHPFPTRLYALLEKSRTDDEIAKMISWHPSGQSFKVHNAKKFSSIVQKKYFRHTVYSSFRRQLNLWRFKRISEFPRTKNSQHGYYSNPMFARGQYSLCCQMRRENATETLCTKQQKNVDKEDLSPRSDEIIKSSEFNPLQEKAAIEPIISTEQFSKNTPFSPEKITSSLVSDSSNCSSTVDRSSVTSDFSSETNDEIFLEIKQQVSYQESIDFFKKALAFVDGQ